MLHPNGDEAVNPFQFLLILVPGICVFAEDGFGHVSESHCSMLQDRRYRYRRFFICGRLFTSSRRRRLPSFHVLPLLQALCLLRHGPAKQAVSSISGGDRI